MKDELLKIAQESLSSDEVSAIVKEKFTNAIADSIVSVGRCQRCYEAQDNGSNGAIY